MIWEYMQRGMASAGWLVGFVVILGLFLVIVGLIGLAFMAIFGGNEEEDEAEAEEIRERLAEKVNGEGARTGKGKRGEEEDL